MNIAFRIAFLILAAMLTACSSGKLVKTYSGDTLSKQEVASLTAGENIVILKVNGESVPEYLISSISVDYGLKPGLNTVTFQYESVWAKRATSDDETRAEAVVSEIREVSFTAEAGDKLSFRYPTASNVREAKSLAANFDAKIINQKGSVIAESTDVSIPVPETSTANAYRNDYKLGGSGVSSLPKLEAVKVLWSEMSIEEQKEFLKWAFQ